MGFLKLRVISKLIRWFSGEDCECPPRYKRGGVTEAINRVARAEKRLLTVEEATMSMTVGDLPEEARAGYEADEEEEDWF